MLYDDVLRFNPTDPKWVDRDRFLLSKGHGCLPLYVILAEKGFFPEEELWKFCQSDGILGGHPEHKVPGVEASTGSLGHGLPIAAGMAFSRKQQKIPGKIYVMISDGECQEGTTWESLLIGSKHKLDNLVVLVDYNKIQALSRLKDALPLGDLSTKFKAFNWDCIKVKDGHSFKSLIPSLKRKNRKGKPLALIINTIKGKGIKEFEDDPIWHARKLQEQDIEIGKKKLGII